MSNDSSWPETVVTTKPKSKETAATKRIPPYNVILLNDDFHSCEFVVEVLQKALGCAQERAYQFMMQAHTSGRSVVWTGPKEVAELKVEQIRTFKEIREPSRTLLGPLDCDLEPAPRVAAAFSRRVLTPHALGYSRRLEAAATMYPLIQRIYC